MSRISFPSTDQLERYAEIAFSVDPVGIAESIAKIEPPPASWSVAPDYLVPGVFAQCACGHEFYKVDTSKLFIDRLRLCPKLGHLNVFIDDALPCAKCNKESANG